MILKKIIELINYNPIVSEKIDGDCALCSDSLDNGSVKFNDLFNKSSFNLNHDFKNMASDHICHSCAVFFSKTNWVKYCTDTGKDQFFPEVKGKKRSVANWVFFSHYFAKEDHRIVKNRQDWRGYLTNPPEPPFCFVLSTICKKHLIFKSEMAYNREVYPIRFEGKNVQIDRKEFSNCLIAFERLYNAGLSKSSIRTGNYSTTAMLKVDRKLLNENDSIVEKYRRSTPDYLAVCEFIGGKNVYHSL